MADEIRLEGAYDRACFGGHCINGECFDSSIGHDLVFPAILQHLLLFIIVFLIGNEDSTPSTASILGLDADLICFEVAGDLK